MSLKLFADQCIPHSIINCLRQAGHEVLKLSDYIPPNSPDQKVIMTAQELDSILISLNGDFSNIISYPPIKYKGIISLQLKNHPEIISELLERLNEYFVEYSTKNYYEGKLFIVEVHRIRIK